MPIRPSSVAVALVFVAATFVFAEPTALSMRVGAPIVGIGLLGWLATALADDGKCPSERGGIYRHVRNPRELALLLLAIGFVLFAASEEPRGRWVPRTVAPLGLLYFFFELLPVADARVREWVRREAGEAGAAYLESVPSLVPRLRPWRGVDMSRFEFRWKALSGTLAVAAVAGVLAWACVQRKHLVEAFGF